MTGKNDIPLDIAYFKQVPGMSHKREGANPGFPLQIPPWSSRRDVKTIDGNSASYIIRTCGRAGEHHMRVFLNLDRIIVGS